MPISFPVARSTILLCDYGTGFREPEMVKRRPVIVVSHRLPHRDHLCTVVPLSTTPPRAPNLLYVHELRLGQPLPKPFKALVMRVKADMMATVSFARLDMFRTGRDQAGKRKYLQPKVPAADMAAIERCICAALGISLTLAP